ncbi:MULTISPECIES: helix-turn-helix transcriptional regulator [Amycolatopsis]|uniref:LuxR family transcriptional regulator n=1 Tax=Amycolatopsis bullii TaxID=941987 RepID=A0ABQ3KPV5_9PSEU|nr:LuxR family transcriptional regulator [Amycolatopsis bullii]GHG42659.1 LuxR family transcriptional regulator [Amycolatopsis bullii]
MRGAEEDSVLVRLAEQFEHARQARGSVVVVFGHAGHGRSALLAAHAEQVERRGGLVLRATATVAERPLRLGVVAQLLQSCPSGQAGLERLTVALDESVDKAPVIDHDRSAHGDSVWAEAIRGMWSALQELSRACPVTILVDDIGYADVASLECLLHFARRLPGSRISLVLSELEHPYSGRSAAHVELAKLPHFHAVRLAPLSLAGTKRLLARTGGAEAARAAEYHEATGGNPKLLMSLLRDRGDADRPGTPPAAGPAFEAAVIGLIDSYGPEALAVARAIAILGDHASSRLAGQLLGIDPASTSQLIATLTESGLLEGNHFRHPATVTAIRHGMSPGDRAALHRAAAELLHSDGAPATAVAGHLLAAPPVEDRWVVPVLEEAADEALADDWLPIATEALQLALRTCDDEDRRAVITMKLALAKWRADPVLAARYYPTLVDALRRGTLRGRHAASLIRSLLWYGRFDDAVEAIEQFGAGQADAESAAELRLMQLRLRHTYPALVVHQRLFAEESAEHSPATMVVRTNANALLAAVLRQDAPEDNRRRAEQLLAATAMSDANLDTLQAALLTLIYGGHVDAAATWSDRLLADAGARQVPSWRAVFAAIRAEVDLRRGDLPSAEYYARAALTFIRPRGWGAAVGAPLGALVRAVTASGRHAEAAKLLDQGVLEATFQTRYGLHFLEARARYSLATGHTAGALTDFLHCGELMRDWGIDLATVVPWRTGAAEVYLRMGEPGRARELVDEQLCGQTPEGSRAHGLALRILAEIEPDAGIRRCLLGEAVEIFENCGDRYELARALVACGSAFLADGDHDGARAAAGRARDLAHEINATPIIDQLHGAGLESLLPTQNRGGAGRNAEGTGALSDAERKVASLAAQGCTNRDIAAKLFITVSTVEQHLTRAYRKLRVTRRMDLPTDLQFDVVGSE